MRAGLLKTRVQIQQKSAVQDTVGQPTESWTTVATVWADVRNQRGLEVVKGDMQMSRLLASIRIRHRAGITAAMRVMQGTNIYNIVTVSPDTNNRDYIDLICERYDG
jgi:SPP1 family predicted phage head-tail adaptor